LIDKQSQRDEATKGNLPSLQGKTVQSIRKIGMKIGPYRIKPLTGIAGRNIYRALGFID